MSQEQAVVPQKVKEGLWVWPMPRIKDEIPELFSAAGTAEVIEETGICNTVLVRVRLKEPIKVVDWQHQRGDGVAINSATMACIGEESPGIYMRSLPRNGDTEVPLQIQLEMLTQSREHVRTLDDMRQALRRFAEAMPRTWFYHFR